MRLSLTVTSFYGTENGRHKGFAALENYQVKEQPNLEQLMATPQEYLQGAASGRWRKYVYHLYNLEK